MAITMKPSNSAFDTEAPHVYSLDRRGPNDPRLGSIHVVIGLMLAALLGAVYLVI